MKILFYKYHGNGNDFILMDNRKRQYDNLSFSVIQKLCHRRFGIGADGLILLNNNSDEYDFHMKYFNADGNESTMCGNGGRCMIQFAGALGMIEKKTKFTAIDGEHEGIIENDGKIKLKMIDVHGYEKFENDYLINTGSPHYVKLTEKVNEINVPVEGKKIRNREFFVKEGVNVNFIENSNELLKVRTYERGVEDETYSCGTGVVASALIASIFNEIEGRQFVNIETPGGNFEVSFVKKSDGSFTDIWLTGGAKFVFQGETDTDFFE